MATDTTLWNPPDPDDDGTMRDKYITTMDTPHLADEIAARLAECLSDALYDQGAGTDHIPELNYHTLKAHLYQWIRSFDAEQRVAHGYRLACCHLPHAVLPTQHTIPSFAEWLAREREDPR